MTTAVIITLCILLIFAYIFDITSSHTRIPSVILLLLLGWGVRQVTLFLGLQIPNLTQILPVIGTFGLILIVLEGSLELELNKSKFTLIVKTFIIAIIPMLIISFGLAFAFQYISNIPFKVGLVNSIPLTIISSAIAIPSVKNLLSADKEFIIYESSLSDIIGIIFFNFILLNDNLGAHSVSIFLLDLLIILLVSLVATIGLALLLSKIEHHVKFVPIILLIILIYSISKIYHLPGLILIILFGLFIGNICKLKQYNIFKHFQPKILEREVHKFKVLTAEAAFLIRALFFLLFGYLIETTELLNLKTIFWALGITAGIFIIRGIHLLILKLPLYPLLFIAPRGLITILLFLSIPVSYSFNIANKSLIIQIIIITALVMMLGLLKRNKKSAENILNEEEL